MKKILLSLLLCGFVLIGLTGCKNDKKIEEDNEVYSLEKCSYKENDNWIYYFCTYYQKDDSGNFTKINGREFNGIDLLKKDTNDKFYITVTDSQTGEIINTMEPGIYTLLNGEKTKQEYLKLSDFLDSGSFNEENFESKLKELELKTIDENLVVELYKASLNEEEVSHGKYDYLSAASSLDIESGNGVFRVGYMIYNGNIKFVKIDYINKDGEFLSNLVNDNEATKDQIEDYNNLLLLEKEIVEKQSLNIDVFDGKTVDTSKLKELLVKMENGNN